MPCLCIMIEGNNEISSFMKKYFLFSESANVYQKKAIRKILKIADELLMVDFDRYLNNSYLSYSVTITKLSFIPFKAFNELLSNIMTHTYI